MTKLKAQFSTSVPLRHLKKFNDWKSVSLRYVTAFNVFGHYWVLGCRLKQFYIWAASA